MSTFHDTVNERKSMVSGARHRVNGSKSKQCSLPSDNLTPAQMRKLNGPVLTYDIIRPMNWEKFKSMPKDLQQDHLNYLHDTFGIGPTTISKFVFGMSGTAVNEYAKRNGLKIPKAGRVAESKMETLKLWLNGTVEETDEEEINEEIVEEKIIENDFSHIIKSQTVTMSGTAAQISQALFELLNNRSADVEIMINYI